MKEIYRADGKAGTGGQPLVGYNYGARNKKRLKEILRFAYLFEAGLHFLKM